MSKPDQTTKQEPRVNPFLTDKADSLWDSLDKNAKPVSKETLLKRIENIKKQNESKG
ncbi:hypothetical protein [Tunicatimonas pelagia]|uniref:hypothetical protein n=1 Tax=Tunicatimonas pelagia TaxID=931531 RepID=UPI0026671549|nr:hypothetical protein [Tunicatimonas pelagia]WKN44379.1 hypothetical protein P0M28_05295 [Tunicatimonas pelagia]